MGVLTTKDIKAGQELFAHYGYTSTTFPSDVPWYWEQKRKIDKKERSKTKRTKTWSSYTNYPKSNAIL